MFETQEAKTVGPKIFLCSLYYIERLASETKTTTTNLNNWKHKNLLGNWKFPSTNTGQHFLCCSYFILKVLDINQNTQLNLGSVTSIISPFLTTHKVHSYIKFSEIHSDASLLKSCLQVWFCCSQFIPFLLVYLKTHYCLKVMGCTLCCCEAWRWILGSVLLTLLWRACTWQGTGKDGWRS